MKCGLVGDGELVRSHGQAAPLLETVDASFDSVALLVCLGIEVGRATSFTASPETVADLISGLRNDGPDPSPAEIPADRAGRVRTVRKDDCRSGSRPPKSTSRNPDPGHDRLECRRVTSLARSDVDGQRPRLAVTDQVHLRAQTTTGASERVIFRFGPVRRPFFLAPAACW